MPQQRTPSKRSSSSLCSFVLLLSPSLEILFCVSLHNLLLFISPSHQILFHVSGHNLLLLHLRITLFLPHFHIAVFYFRSCFVSVLRVRRGIFVVRSVVWVRQGRYNKSALKRGDRVSQLSVHWGMTCNWSLLVFNTRFYSTTLIMQHCFSLCVCPKTSSCCKSILHILGLCLMFDVHHVRMMT